MPQPFHFHRGSRNSSLPDGSKMPAAETRLAASLRWARQTRQVFADHPQKPKLLRPLFYLLLITAAVLFVLAQLAHAGDPKYIAGVSYFDASVKGTPLTWAQGNVQYYTDQGDLSPVLPGASADAFVADAFAHWTQISTAAVSATRAGQLGEDVSGQNVIANPDHTITMPADIQPTATNKPVAVVYDLDGQVTDALLGAGAGDPLYCSSNSAFGGLDNFSTNAHIIHALVVMNGNCVQTTAQQPDMTYHLVRVLGEVLGLDWSQLNINVITRSPVPTSDDFYGFPLMHFTDMVSCVPVSACYPNADQPKMDDQAAISRLYPITSQNLSNFPGKQLFYETTVRIHGSVYFVDAQGQPAQPMQGVNVVARWIDPKTGTPSRKYSASFISGALFRGNAGNVVNGPTDSLGQRYDRFGSDDPAVEGFFDLAGLQIPDGSNSAQYQLSVEAVDPNWSSGVGPYAPWQVTPSGGAQPVTVTVSKGGDAQQNLLMQGSAIDTPDWGEPASYAAPAQLPSNAEWTGLLSGYGNADFFQFAGQANRTLSVAVTALDESGSPTQNKARPIIGIWSLSDPVGTLAPAYTPTAFNAPTFGMTRLDASLSGTTTFRIAITDERGDGRPDFSYHAHVLYGDSVTPSRVSMRGGTPLIIQGLGFAQGMTGTVGTMSASVLSVTPSQFILIAPAPANDGVQSITISDAVTGGYSLMTDAVTYGAAATDNIAWVYSWSKAIPVGGETPKPLRVRVTAADGVTPVTGATVSWSANAGAKFSLCGDANTCSVATDENGETSTRVTIASVGTTVVTATLAPAAYKSPKQVTTNLTGTSSASDIALSSQYRYLATGVTVDLPLKARVMSYGQPQSGKTVIYQIQKGSASLSSTTAYTDPNGYATTTLHVTNLASEVDVSACVGSSCDTFYVYPVAMSALRLVNVSGSGQMVTVGQPFQPITVRVTDFSSPANPVQGATVTFQSTVLRPDYDAPVENNGDSSSSHHGMPVILGTSTSVVTSDGYGQASLVPTARTSGAVEIELVATAGITASLRFEVESLWPIPAGNAAKTAASSSADPDATAGTDGEYTLRRRSQASQPAPERELD
jgi:IPT/TIG domain